MYTHQAPPAGWHRPSRRGNQRRHRDAIGQQNRRTSICSWSVSPLAPRRSGDHCNAGTTFHHYHVLSPYRFRKHVMLARISQAVYWYNHRDCWWQQQVREVTHYPTPYRGYKPRAIRRGCRPPTIRNQGWLPRRRRRSNHRKPVTAGAVCLALSRLRFADSAGWRAHPEAEPSWSATEVRLSAPPESV